MLTMQNYLYLCVRIDNLIVWPKNRSERPPRGDAASTAEADPGRVGRGEQNEARPAISVPRDGPHLELGRIRLKAWSKSDFSTAGKIWRTISCMYLHFCYRCYRKKELLIHWCGFTTQGKCDWGDFPICMNTFRSFVTEQLRHFVLPQEMLPIPKSSYLCVTVAGYIDYILD